MQLAELLLGDGRRGVHHQILGALVHREGDHLANVLRVGEQHDHAVHARRDAAVRRRAVLERAGERREAVENDVRAVAGDLERLDHHVETVVADRAGGELHAVADHVVLVRQHVERILRRQRLHAALRHRERVVGEDDRAGLLVALEHREVHDPAEAEDVLLDDIQVAAELETDVAGHLGRRARLVAQEEHHVAIDHAGARGERRELLGRHELRDRPLDLVRVPDDVAEALRAEILRMGLQLVEEAARHTPYSQPYCWPIIKNSLSIARS